jgi:hypothetical protein
VAALVPFAGRTVTTAERRLGGEAAATVHDIVEQVKPQGVPVRRPEMTQDIIG